MAERKEVDGARRAVESAGGMVLRATRRGALVLETENARRMMRRFSKRQSDPEPDAPQDPDAAPAQP
jgi:hypothetical protein